MALVVVGISCTPPFLVGYCWRIEVMTPHFTQIGGRLVGRDVTCNVSTWSGMTQNRYGNGRHPRIASSILVGKGAVRLGSASVFPHNVKSQI